MPQPKSGRIGRSPNAVPRISRIDSSSSRLPLDQRRCDPVASVRSGNAQPRPMNSDIAQPTITVVTVGTRLPGSRSRSRSRVAFTAGLPSKSTVGLPDDT